MSYELIQLYEASWWQVIASIENAQLAAAIGIKQDLVVGSDAETWPRIRGRLTRIDRLTYTECGVSLRYVARRPLAWMVKTVEELRQILPDDAFDAPLQALTHRPSITIVPEEHLLLGDDVPMPDGLLRKARELASEKHPRLLAAVK
ncbi:MAG TPA: hypothetical protein VNA25_17910 [Phycisphaerae bacterium]|nr:hypothetical protein [Phycisphaerae bacterium]